ncbi:MAG TPA: hypothetical protein VF773_11980 [Verrucomicrobiae bacterium]
MNALTTLIRFATDKIETRPPEQQAEIYDAISNLMIDPKESVAAERLAFAIRETAKLQLDFNSKLVGQTTN